MISYTKVNSYPLDVDSIYLNIDNGKGLQAVKEVTTYFSLFHSIIYLLDMSSQTDDIMFVATGICSNL